MSEFQLYMEMGMAHIADITAYDHIVFIIALCAMYRLIDWKKVLILVTAFTIGHSITLALSTLNIVTFPSRTIEILIPITIILTAIFNVWERSEKERQRQSIKYGLALFFGLIHGMGFSNYLKMLLGEEESIFTPLFAFNIGIEVGQIGIVVGILLLGYLVMDVLRAKQREWNLFISGATAGIALMLLVNLLTEI